LAIIIAALVPSIFDIKTIHKLKNENKKLRANLQEFTERPLELRDGIYFDKDNNPYCGGCHSSVYDCVPLKTRRKSDAWVLYECPKCKTRYETGTPPAGNHDHWDPLA
jgi:hypothetical protein